MTRTYFEETQSLRGSRWVWILIIVIGSGTLFPLIYGMYWQIGNGEPWGDEPMSDIGLISLTIFVSIALIVAFWTILSTTLDIRIDAHGIHYKFFPNKPKWCMVSRDEIESFEIRKRFNLFDTGIGFRKNWFNKTKSMNVMGCKTLLLLLKNREKIILGTQDPEGIERAMKKLMDKNEAN